MNEMRKLMEAIEEAQIDEMPGRSRSRHDKRDPSEVLQYFSNKRSGGKIKDGYEALIPFDDEMRKVEGITITQNSDMGREYNISGQSWRGRDDWRTFTLDNIEIYEVEKKRIL